MKARIEKIEHAGIDGVSYKGRVKFWNNSATIALTSTGKTPEEAFENLKESKRQAQKSLENLEIDNDFILSE